MATVDGQYSPGRVAHRCGEPFRVAARREYVEAGLVRLPPADVLEFPYLDPEISQSRGVVPGPPQQQPPFPGFPIEAARSSAATRRYLKRCPQEVAQRIGRVADR